MRLFARSPTNSRPRESIAIVWGTLSSPGAAPSVPHALMKRPSLDHLLTRPAPPWRPDDFRGTEAAAGILLEMAGAAAAAPAPSSPVALAGGS